MKHRVLVVAMACVVGLSACQEDDENVQEQSIPRPVAALQVGSTEFLGQRSFPGRARAAREVSLAFRVSGTMSKRGVSVGDIVEEKDIVAVLDPDPFTAEVARLEADLEAAKADFAAKDEQLGRVAKLVESGTYSESRGDLARAQRDTSAARVDSVSSALERANLDLTYTSLRAPFPGRVVAVYAEDFEEVAAQAPVVRLLDASKVEIVIDVPETLISLVPLVETLEVRFDALPDVLLEGTVKEIGAEASQITRTYPITIVMDQPADTPILPGMSGWARASKVSQPGRASGIVIPESAIRALQDESDQMAVWVVDDATNTVSLRPVRLGRLLSVGIEVLDGLSAGEWIVTAGTHSLTEGQEVRIQSADDGAS